jgi:ABC-type glycerol-3-phosphate transport system substrate-binding protein
LAQNPDIEIAVSPVPAGQQRDKLIVSMAAGTPPDIVMFKTPIVGWALQGIITPLDSMIATSKVIRPQDYPPGMLDLFKVNGSQYAIPGIEVGPNNGLIMNADVLEASGVPAKAPATLDELFSIGKKATRMDGDQITQLGYYPLSGTVNDCSTESWPFVWDLTLYDPVKRKMNIDTPAMLDMLQYIKSYFDSVPAAAVQSFISKNGKAGWANLQKGKVAINWTGYFSPGRLLTAGAMDEFHFTYGWVPNVRKDKMQLLMGWGMAIPTGAKHPKEAFKVMEGIISPDSARLIFDRNGWLNGNLKSMAQLDTKKNLGAQWYIQSLTQADRVRIPENNPISDDTRTILLSKMWPIMRGELAPKQALSEAQNATQALLDAWKW